MIGRLETTEGYLIANPEAKDALMKVLVSPKDGFKGYVMREIEINESGYTPKHSHPWPHINYVIGGIGELQIGSETKIVTAGAYAFIPEDTIHQFRNAGQEVFRFICIVPEIGHK